MTSASSAWLIHSAANARAEASRNILSPSVAFRQPDVSLSGSPCRRPNCCTSHGTSDVGACRPAWRQRTPKCYRPRPPPPTGVRYRFFVVFVPASVSSLHSDGRLCKRSFSLDHFITSMTSASCLLFLSSLSGLDERINQGGGGGFSY